jgi:hypothetical protein
MNWQAKEGRFRPYNLQWRDAAAPGMMAGHGRFTLFLDGGALEA